MANYLTLSQLLELYINFISAQPLKFDLSIVVSIKRYNILLLTFVFRPILLFAILIKGTGIYVLSLLL